MKNDPARAGGGVMTVFDVASERFVRRFARGSSRRSVLARFSALLVAAPAFPLLPMSRAKAAEPDLDGLTDFQRNAQTKDPTKCSYWRHCAIDGILCGCCGGGVHTCPPGSEPSPICWIGTCRNPDDGKSYVIAYRDCCGRNSCTTKDPDCTCNTNDGDLPIYMPFNSNDILWCFGKAAATYHCSTAVLMGAAK